MKTSYKILTIAVIFLVLGFLILVPGHKWAREHVNSKTGVTDHPLWCVNCHLYMNNSGIIGKLINEKYLSPLNLAVSDDGKRLYVVAQEAGALLVVDPDKKKVLNKITVGDQPHSVVLSNDGKKAYVSNQWSDNVSVIDLNALKVTDTLKTANGPAGMSLSADGRYLYVTDSYSSNISVIDLTTKEEISRFDAGNNPTGSRLSPDGKTLLVPSRRTIISSYGDTLKTDLTIVDESSRRIKEQRPIESAYMMENVAFTPTGDLALIPIIRPKNYVPSIQVEQGFIMNYGVAIVEPKENGRVIQLLVDEPNAYYSDPFGIAITPDGRKAFITSSGTNTISVLSVDSLRAIINKSTPQMLRTFSNYIGLSSRFVLKRIHTGADPKGMAISPDGKLLYVAEQLEDKVTVINTDNLETVNTIDLGGPKRITVYRQGRRLFSNSGGTFQNQFDCNTCHPDMHEDGLIYNMASKDMGRNLTNTMTLRDVGKTPPYKWTGKNSTVYRQDGIRFSTVLTRTEQFSYKDLDALASYITAGIPNPPNLQYNPDGELTPSQKRGKVIFERKTDTYGKTIPEANRCVTCHPAPYYTNMKMTYVKTLAVSDDSMLFDTPHLNNIYASAPYLHDGRAKTLEEIWTIYGKDDKHGQVNDLTKMQLNDLIDYLKSLRAPMYEYRDAKKHHTESNPN